MQTEVHTLTRGKGVSTAAAMASWESETQTVDVKNFSETPLYNTKAVAEQTGVPAPTLRAWERRYKLLTPQRAENTYRLYSERDIIIIRWLKERVDSGLSISQATAMLNGLQKNGGKLVLSSANATGYNQAIRAGSTTSRAPKRRSLILLQDELLRSFYDFDEEKTEAILEESFATHSLEDVCLELIEPTMTRVGKLWEGGELGIPIEHFASSIIRNHLGSLLRSEESNPNEPLAIVACTCGETHELGSMIVTLFMRRKHLQVIYLGANIEVSSFLETIEHMHPALVCLSASTIENFESLIEIGEKISKISQTQPVIFGYGGRIFPERPEIMRLIPGVFLGANAAIAAQNAYRLVARK